jgi:uncharacterized coiled-coil protein SlyX
MTARSCVVCKIPLWGFLTTVVVVSGAMFVSQAQLVELTTRAEKQESRIVSLEAMTAENKTHLEWIRRTLQEISAKLDGQKGKDTP